MAPEPLVGVVILHWGPEEVTMRCLQSLRRVRAPRMVVFLVDNGQSLPASIVESAAPLEVRVLHPPRNLGFAEGSNWGMTVALQRGVDYLLLLNNDAVVGPAFLVPLVETARLAPHAGLLCPQIAFLDEPEVLWYGGGRFSLWTGIPRHTGWRRRIEVSQSPREVDFATGCAVLIKPVVIARVGCFDPRFFAYCEDLDLSLRARKAGFRILLVPASVVYHAVPRDETRLPRRLYYSTRNLLEVMHRHAAWYQWLSSTPNLLLRWIGFFCLLAGVRRQPDLIGSLMRGVWDFVRGELGEQKPVSVKRA